MSDRRYSLFDRLITEADKALRTVLPGAAVAARANPAAPLPTTALTPDQSRHVAGLMRVDHTGEVCAQALYQGQAFSARLPQVRARMAQAAAEEVDHLAWCEERLRELDASPSLLNPVWYAMSFGIGAAAGLAGDKWSLGFVAETERQVCRHLESHLTELPATDDRSRAILSAMHKDEAEHTDWAVAAGGADLPSPVKSLMQAVAKVMTTTAYRL